jgi:hypothetical protein
MPAPSEDPTVHLASELQLWPSEIKPPTAFRVEPKLKDKPVVEPGLLDLVYERGFKSAPRHKNSDQKSPPPNNGDGPGERREKLFTASLIGGSQKGHALSRKANPAEARFRPPRAHCSAL